MRPWSLPWPALQATLEHLPSWYPLCRPIVAWPLSLLNNAPPAAGNCLPRPWRRGTTLPVIHAHDGWALEHGRIYVIAPNAAPTIAGGRIYVTPVAGELEASADDLFTSLAQESGDEAIGVILSGGGSQRSLGVRAIRQAGGTTFAQYPGSARFPNMPISAIDTGCVDFVLRPNEIARELTRISRHAEKAPRGAFRRRQMTQPEPILVRHAPSAAGSVAE